MFDTTYLHIGLDKTGSTAIQTACFGNMAKLAEFGVHYPLDSWHAQFGSVWASDPETYFFNSASGRTGKGREYIEVGDKEYLAALGDEISRPRGRCLVLSYEGFYELDVEALRRMRRYLAERSRRIEVVMYCRDPLSYARSAISQIAKTGLDTSHPPTVHAFRDICEKFAEVFGRTNLNVREFSRAAMLDGDVRLDFLNTVGLSIQQIRALELAGADGNASLSSEAIAISQALVKLRSNVTGTLHDFDSRYGRILEKIRGEQYQLTAAQLEFVLVESKPHVDYLFENFDIDLRPASSVLLHETAPAFGQTFIDSIAELLHMFTGSAYTGAQLDSVERGLLEREISSADIAVVSARVDSPLPYARGEVVEFIVEFFAERTVPAATIGIHIFDSKYRWVFGTNSSLIGEKSFQVQSGPSCVKFYFPADLPAGQYSVGVSLNEQIGQAGKELIWRGKVCEFEVSNLAPLTSVGYVDLPTAVTLINGTVPTP